LQLVRLLANLCISPDIGKALVTDKRLDGLLPLIQNTSLQSHTDLVMNVVGCINNMSFYAVDGNRVLAHRMDLSNALASFLLSSEMDLVVEVRVKRGYVAEVVGDERRM
jgi:hypothetical protein